MKNLLIFLFFFAPIIKIVNFGMIDNRIATENHTEITKVNEVPTIADIEKLILDIKVIKSEIEMIEADKKLDSFFADQPYKVLKKKHLLTNQL